MAIKALSQLIATPQKWRDVLDTPAVVVDLDVVEKNLRRGADVARANGLEFRPHIKTHKIPMLAKAQLELGAVGITAQKISEAEVMVDAGITDVLISYNIVGDQKLRRLRSLSERAKLRTVADHKTVVSGLAEHFHDAQTECGVLVELDGGMNRCGATTADVAMEVAHEIDAAQGLRFDGFMIYPAPNKWKQALDFLAECKLRCTQEGLSAPVLSTGGTPDMLNVMADDNVTEYRAGSYIYNDRSLVEFGAVSEADCALSVLATVVSTPTEHRAVVDAGSKSLTSDLFGMEDFGIVKGHAEARVFVLSEEHGHIEFPVRERPLIGDKLDIIPNHACVVSNLVDYIHFVRGDYLVGKQAVVARGTVT